MSKKPAQEKALEFGALVAHQLKSPVGAAGSLLKTLLGEYVGHLNPQQKDLLERADRRLQEAMDSVSRMLTTVRAGKGGGKADAVTEVAALVRRTQ